MSYRFGNMYSDQESPSPILYIYTCTLVPPAKGVTARHGILRKRVSIAGGRFSQILEGYVELIELKVWKPIS